MPTPNHFPPLIENPPQPIPLYTTHFLYIPPHQIPTQQHQFQPYKQLLQPIHPKPLVLPTLHIPRHKQLSYLNFPQQINPFLPYPPIPLSLPQQHIFTPHLPPLLPASLYPKLNIIFPML
ncbi:putative PEP-binding protein, partial [Staphylococcus aureus]|uniref:putative PEP-binding protein n=1 Tax=Staphylococcus aureus TaxID=1280 RepID=UPI0037D99C30